MGEMVEERKKRRKKEMADRKQAEQDVEYGMGIKKEKKKEKSMNGWRMLAMNRKEVGERRVKKEKEK